MRSCWNDTFVFRLVGFYVLLTTKVTEDAENADFIALPHWGTMSSNKLPIRSKPDLGETLFWTVKLSELCKIILITPAYEGTPRGRSRVATLLSTDILSLSYPFFLVVFFEFLRVSLNTHRVFGHSCERAVNTSTSTHTRCPGRCNEAWPFPRIRYRTIISYNVVM